LVKNISSLEIIIGPIAMRDTFLVKKFIKEIFFGNKITGLITNEAEQKREETKKNNFGRLEMR